MTTFSTAAKRGITIAASAALVASLSIATSATAAPGTHNLAPVHAAQGKAIAGQYIVVLKDGANAESTAQRLGVTTRHVYKSALSGFSATLSAAQLAKVRADKHVAYVDHNGAVHTQDEGPSTQTTQTPTPAWGLDRVDQRAIPLNNTYRWATNGTGVTAYVIDTGIRSSHNDFSGRSSSGYDFVDNDTNADDCYGHGTHVAGTIGGGKYGVAKNVKLKAVRVLDCSGSGSWDTVIAGIDWVSANHNGPSVANMSLGGGYTQSVNDAVANSMAEGVIYALAAGNSGDDACNYSPASTPLALTIGATDTTDTRAYFSNYGTCVDVFAPGVDITSDWNTSNSATNTISGTSMATPHVAGLVAQFLQVQPYATQPTVNSVITGTASYGQVSDPVGSPNLLARKWTGNLSATGSQAIVPDNSYWYQGNAGYIRAWLRGTQNVDLYLQKWNGSEFVDVAHSTTATNMEKITYSSAAGSYYRMRVKATSGGGGAFDAWASHPA